MAQLNALFAGMASWHLGNTARQFQAMGALGGYWVGNTNRSGVRPTLYKRIWPYHLAQKSFYHLPFKSLEERMRWYNLPFYDAWMSRQALPTGVSVVQGPMGSCMALFELAKRSGRKVLKVFDSTNSHPTSQFGYWQRECDLYCPGYVVPPHQRVRSRIVREIESADLILCPSFFVRDSIVQNGIREQKCFVSPYGVDTELFTKRTTLPEQPRFICAGSVTLRKGHQYLFRAFEKVRSILPTAELICVGGLRPDFKIEMKRWQGSFLHLDILPQTCLATLLSSSTAFVFPSLEEGFARVLSEAMAAGLPILASYESGATTVIKNGVNGIILNPRDVEGMAHAMLLMATNREMNVALGNSSYEMGARSNTWSHYARRLYEEYQTRINFCDNSQSEQL
jgi:glycosyltransferase involved in cell wall biosynthesis